MIADDPLERAWVISTNAAAGDDEEEWPELDLVAGDDAPPLIPPGQYEAIAKRFETPSYFEEGARKLVIHFKILGTKYDGIILPFNCPLPARRAKKSAPIGSRSKFYRCWVAANGGQVPARGDRMGLNVFQRRLLVVRVRTSKKDRHQQPLPQSAWYSVIDMIMGRSA